MNKILLLGLFMILIISTMISATITTSGDANERYNVSTATCRWEFEDGALYAVNYTDTTERGYFQSASTGSTMFSVRNSSGTSYFQYGTESTTQTDEYNNMTDYITMIYSNPTFGATLKYKIFDDECYMLWETYSTTMNASITTFIQNATSAGGVFQSDWVYNNTNRLVATSGGNDYSNSPSGPGVALTYNRSLTNYSVIFMWNASLTNNANDRVNYTYFGGSTATVEGVHLYNRGKLPLTWVARGILEIARINTTQTPDFNAVVNTLNQTLTTRSLNQEFSLSDATSPSNLYVNISHGACSDSYNRAQATNIETPWCTLTPPLFSELVLAGDTLIIASGNYNLNGSLSNNWLYNGKTMQGNLTIRSALNNNVNITRYTYYSEFVSLGSGLWRFNISGNQDTTNIYAITPEGEHYFVYTTNTQYINFSRSNYPNSIWTNSSKTPDWVYLHYNDTSFTPNSSNVYILQSYPITFEDLRFQNNTQLVIDGINFAGLFGLRIRNVTNLIIQNSKFTSPYVGIRIDGRDDFQSGNITIINNTFSGTLLRNFTVSDINDNIPNKGSAIRSEDVKGQILITQNNFTRWRSSVSLYSDEQKEHNNSRIWNNTMYYGTGSQFEIEDYCSNTSYDHNIVTQNYYAGVSMAPAHATQQQSCYFGYNIIASNYTYRWTETTNYGAFGIKAEARNNLNVSNWLIDHNTIIAAGRAIDNMGVVSGTPPGVFANTTFTNNIFQTTPDTTLTSSSYLIVRSGQSLNGVLYDYNLYYATNVANMFIKWNSESSSSAFNTLTAAKASAYWDGVWDINSEEGYADFQDSTYTTLNLAPVNTSIACSMSSTGSFIGALPCVDSTDTLLIYLNSSLNNTVLGYNTSQNFDFYFTDTRNAVANCTFYVDGNANDEQVGAVQNTVYFVDRNDTLPNGNYQAWVNCTNIYGTSKSNEITLIYETPTERATDLTIIDYGRDYITLGWTNPEISDFDHNDLYLDGVYVSTITGTLYNFTGLSAGTTYNLSVRSFDVLSNYGEANITVSTRSFPYLSMTYWLTSSNLSRTCQAFAGGSFANEVQGFDDNWATATTLGGGGYGYCNITYPLPRPTSGAIPPSVLTLTWKNFNGQESFNIPFSNIPNSNYLLLNISVSGADKTNLTYYNTTGSWQTISAQTAGSAGFYETNVTYNYTTTQELAITSVTTLNGSQITSATICNVNTSNCTTGTLPLYLAMFNGTQTLNTATNGNWNYTTDYTSTGNTSTTITQIANTIITWLRQFDNASITAPLCYYDSDKTNLITTNGNYYYLAVGTSSIYCLAYTRTETYTITVPDGTPFNTTLYFNWSGASITFKDSTTNLAINTATLEVYYFGGDYYQNYTTTNSTISVYYPYPGTYNLRYQSPGYNVRNYYIIVENDSITPLTLYLLNGTGATNLTVTVIDETTDPVSSVQVKLLKFDLTTNTFILDEVGTTNSNGVTILSVLLNGPFYKFIIQDGTTVLKTTDPEVLTSNAKTISIGTTNTYGEEAYKYNDYTASLTFNEATGNFRLDFNDADGLGDGTALVVYINDNMTYTLYNTTSTTSSAGSILINAANVTGRTYTAYAYYIDPSKGGGYSYLAGKTYTYLAVAIFGTYGLFMQILLTIGASSLIFLNAPAAVVLTPLTIGIGNWLGWVQISWAVIIGLIATGLLIAYMLMGKR